MLGRLKRASARVVDAAGGWKGMAGWFIMLLGIPFFIELLLSDDPLGETDGNFVIFLWGYAAAILVVFAVFSHAHARDRDRTGKRQLGTVAALMVVGLSGTAYLLSAAALSVSELSQKPGWPVSYEPKQESLDIGDVNLKILYEAVHVVPFLDIPQTLGWEDPVPRPAPVLGWACLIVKVVLLTVVLTGFTKLIRPPATPGAEPSSSTTDEDD